MNQPTIRPLLAALAGGALAVFATGRGPADCRTMALSAFFRASAAGGFVSVPPARSNSHIFSMPQSHHTPPPKDCLPQAKTRDFHERPPAAKLPHSFELPSACIRVPSPLNGEARMRGGSNPAITQENFPSTTVFGHLVHPVQHPSGMQDISLEQPPPVKSSAIYF